MGSIEQSLWASDTLQLSPVSFSEGYSAAKEIIEADVSLAADQRSIQELPLNVLGALKASGQGVERQLNSNAAFLFGAVSAAFEKIHSFERGKFNV